MKKIINFYIRAFLIVSFISIPFIFIAFEDFKTNSFSYKMWIATFFPQLIYTVYLFKTQKWYDDFKNNFFGKSCNYWLALFSCLTPFIVYFSLILFKWIKVENEINWDIEIVGYFILIFLSALLEEILFRYIPYKILVKEVSVKNIILVSVFFSFFHLFNPNVNITGLINIVVAGVFFSLIYLKSNSIFFCSFIHAFWNFAIGCILGSNISGIKTISLLQYYPEKPDFLSGGEFGFEGSIVTTIVFLISGFFIYQLKTNEISEVNGKEFL
ncbi:lysostaphin resistance A-like protein [Flavobacterium sp. CFS9]|uniref:CPBP family intramembrane glutamic endopeptidase n=1 Tax=Flavobacterium sp. CFS9 TaxID=3143118 RepID=UPI0034E8922E